MVSMQYPQGGSGHAVKSASELPVPWRSPDLSRDEWPLKPSHQVRLERTGLRSPQGLRASGVFREWKQVWALSGEWCEIKGEERGGGVATRHPSLRGTWNGTVTGTSGAGSLLVLAGLGELHWLWEVGRGSPELPGARAPGSAALPAAPVGGAQDREGSPVVLGSGGDRAVCPVCGALARRVPTPSGSSRSHSRRRAFSQQSPATQSHARCSCLGLAAHPSLPRPCRTPGRAMVHPEQIPFPHRARPRLSRDHCT